MQKAEVGASDHLHKTSMENSRPMNGAVWPGNWGLAVKQTPESLSTSQFQQWHLTDYHGSPALVRNNGREMEENPSMLVWLELKHERFEITRLLW